MIEPVAAVSSPRPFNELSDYPVAFKIDNGTVVEIYPALEETEEILNIKRGIISAFQVHMTGTDGQRTIEEVRYCDNIL